jgi:GT2 family glycosyltransferase
MEKTYSLIIPVLDRLEVLKLLYRTINSRYNLKILLLDNGSQKETVDFLKMVSADPRTYVTYDSFNHGAAYARNAGMAFAFNNLKSEGVFFIDSDVILGKGCLDELIDFHEKSGASISFSNDQKKEGFSYREFIAPDFKPTLKGGQFQTSECCFLDKKTFEAVGYFDEMFYPVYCEDMDYFYRAKLKGLKLLDCPSAYHYHFKDKIFGENKELEDYKKRKQGFLEEYYYFKWGGPYSKEKFTKPFNSDWKGLPKIGEKPEEEVKTE